MAELQLLRERVVEVQRLQVIPAAVNATFPYRVMLQTRRSQGNAEGSKDM